jgi:molybdopterin-guanine dinucleotide biosynthesis protein A
LQAVYCREPALDVAEETLREGGLSAADLVKKLADVVFVSVEDEIEIIDPELRTFFNVNTREDLAKAERILSKS